MYIYIYRERERQKQIEYICVAFDRALRASFLFSSKTVGLDLQVDDDDDGRRNDGTDKGRTTV